MCTVNSSDLQESATSNCGADRAEGPFIAILAYLHFGVAAAVDDAGVLDGLTQHAQRVVQAALGLIQHMRACIGNTDNFQDLQYG